MTVRYLIVSLFLVAATFSVASSRVWDPRTAVIDAERDIAASRIRFCYIGGYVPHAPGVPDKAYGTISSYKHIEVGSQTCLQDATFSARNEYARLYNIRMLQHISHHH